MIGQKTNKPKKNTGLKKICDTNSEFSFFSFLRGFLYWIEIKVSQVSNNDHRTELFILIEVYLFTFRRLFIKFRYLRNRMQ